VSVKLTVAVVGSPEATWEGGLVHPDDWDVPYAARAKVEIEVPEGTPLGYALQKAATELGVPGPPWEPTTRYRPAFIAFYREDRDRDFGRLRSEVSLLNEDGRARWTHSWRDERMSEYIRAGDAGVLDGDPRRPYLILQPEIGNGILADFPTFVELWKLWWDIANKAAIAAGIYAGWDLLKRKCGSRKPTESPQIMEGRYAEWKRNGSRPDNLLELLGQRPWHEEDLANLLGCTSDEAEALMLGLGYETNSAGLWVVGQSEQAKLLQGNAEFVVHAGMTTRTDAMERVLRGRAEHFRDTGKAAPLDWTELRDLTHDMSRMELSEDYELPDVEQSLRDRIEVVLRYRPASALFRLRELARRRKG
jgi:hypothetical protein